MRVLVVSIATVASTPGSGSSSSQPVASRCWTVRVPGGPPLSVWVSLSCVILAACASGFSPRSSARSVILAAARTRRGAFLRSSRLIFFGARLSAIARAWRSAAAGDAGRLTRRGRQTVARCRRWPLVLTIVTFVLTWDDLQRFALTDAAGARVAPSPARTQATTSDLPNKAGSRQWMTGRRARPLPTLPDPGSHVDG